MDLKFEFLIGIECHVKLNYNKKLFSLINIINNYSNRNVSDLDLGFPGSLPILNLWFFKKIIIFGIFIKSHIYKISYFLRKSYFYPDISKNYQITQNNFSFIKFGYIIIYNNYVHNSYYKFIYIKQAHLEEDVGKINYKLSDSFINYNRAGCILLEIVSLPCIFNFYESILYLSNLRYLLNFLDLSSCNMEDGDFRFDINFSLKKISGVILNYKIELKNLNSYKYLFDIINFEIKRLIYIYVNGIFINSKTISYDPILKTSVILRNKETFLSYRYFFDPDLFYSSFKKKIIFFIFNKIFNWFKFYKLLNYKLNRMFKITFFIFNKKIFYLFILVGFYFKCYINIFTFFFVDNKFISYKIFFSFEQILILIKFYFYFITRKIFQKFYDFLYKYKFTWNEFLYKVIFINLYKKKIDVEKIKYSVNKYIFKNLQLVHNIIYNRNLLNNYIVYFLNEYNNNYNILNNIFIKKIYIWRDGWVV